jgi:DMSO/TMAO reductase YedYZ molybdopterin-dependent catalytic subunit
MERSRPGRDLPAAASGADLQRVAGGQAAALQRSFQYRRRQADRRRDLETRIRRPHQIYQLPEQEIIIKHICVEGWDYIGQWSGPNLRDFLQRVGADLTAKYVYFICNDDYTESIDMATALHPQTILATKYAGQVLADPFGYPLRLRTSTKLGYKNAKWIKAIEVTNDFRETFWSKQGFNWFAGI